LEEYLKVKSRLAQQTAIIKKGFALFETYR
jgi:hypothetical protein